MGYRRDSPYKHDPFIDIFTPGGLIDMSKTDINLLGIDNKGNKKVMKARSKNPYKFEGDVVREIPLTSYMQDGGFFSQMAEFEKKRNKNRSMPANIKRDFTQKDVDDMVKNPLIKKKAVVFVEAPINERRVYNMDDRNLPSKYKKLRSDIETLSIQLQKLMAKENPSDEERLMQGEIPIKIAELEQKFYDDTENPVKRYEQDETFIKEAQNLWKFYKKNEPNREVKILPVYGDKDKEKISQAFQNLGFQDDVFVFGHHGNMFAGLDNNFWANNMRNSTYNNCYLGSCGSEDLAQTYFKDIKNFNYRPVNSWWGVNPNASNVKDAMFSRISPPGFGNPYIGEPTKSVDYNTINPRQKRGGVINPYKQMGGVNQIFQEIFGYDEEEDDDDMMEIPIQEDEIEDKDMLAHEKAEMVSLENMEREMAIMEAMREPEYIFSNSRSHLDDDNVPYTAALSSGKHGSQNIGEHGRKIINEVTSALGYRPTFNSIYRDRKQQDQLIRSGAPAVKNSWHLTGNAVDMKPEDWHRLSPEKQKYFKQNYDVVYHNNHYHIEPKG